jgi:hypothetical protein
VPELGTFTDKSLPDDALGNGDKRDTRVLTRMTSTAISAMMMSSMEWPDDLERHIS